MLEKFLKLKDFLTKGIWSMHLSDFSPRRAMQLKTLRVLIISIRGIYEDKIQQRAAALTLYTLLSIVPILAMGFGIAKGFGYDKMLKAEVETYLDTKIEEAKATSEDEQQQNVEYYEGYKQVVKKIIFFADAMLAKTQGGLVAGIGIALLFWTIMKVLSNIENSFNDIWQVKKGRSFVRKISDYLSMMLISPIFFITASALNVYVNEKLLAISKHVEVVNLISPVLFMLLKVVPYLLIFVLFTLVYIIMPNTKVNFKAGLAAGILAGAVFQITQMAYIYFQVGVSSNNAIYGTFAAVPLFILWLQVSWLIVLFGAKVSYATQNVDMYEFENEAVHMSDYSRRILALLVTHKVVQNFKQGMKPLSYLELSKELHIPIRMLKNILNDLLQCRILCEVVDDKQKNTCFVPAQDIERFSIKFVIESLDKQGENYLAHKHEVTHKFVDFHDRFFKHIEELPENVLIKDV